MLRFRLPVIFACALALSALRPEPVAAAPLLVFDAETGEVVHAEQPGAPWYPASLTKLMTAFLTFHAIRDGKLSLDTKIEVTRNAAAQPPSKIGLPVGSKISVDKALQAVIVRSANDLAVTLGEAVAGSEERFVKLMNAWARRLGMSGSYFANPHGLPDPRQVTTARDMGLLAQAIIDQFPEHARYFKMQSVKIGRRNFRARNSLLKHMEEADGMKTGFICASGYNLVASATRNGRRLVAVIMGSQSGWSRMKLAKDSLEGGFAKNGKDGKKVGQFSNGGFFQRTPKNMQPVVCKKRAAVRVAGYWQVRGWGVDFGRFPNAKAAYQVMSENLLALRNVVYAGRGAVVKDYRAGGLAAIMSGFDQEQAQHVCDHLKKQNTSCTLFSPDAFKPPASVLAEQERKRKAAQKKAKKKKKKKRVVKKKGKRKKAVKKKSRKKKKAVKKKSRKKKATKKKKKKPRKKKQVSATQNFSSQQN